MKILLTGFDPFGGEKVNPAWEAVRQVKDKIQGADIIKLQIPTVFQKSWETIFEAIEKHQPDVILSIGQAGGRAAMSVEFVGINWVDARIGDNEGNQPFGRKIFVDAENAYFSNLPVKSMVAYMQKNGVPAFLSYTAGTFVCNDVLYGVLYYIHKNAQKWGKSMRSGFIHVPFAAEQVLDKPSTTPFMEIEAIKKGIEYAIEAIVTHESDLEVAMGNTH